MGDLTERVRWAQVRPIGRVSNARSEIHDYRDCVDPLRIRTDFRASGDACRAQGAYLLDRDSGRDPSRLLADMPEYHAHDQTILGAAADE